jgi:hypothetical protein
MRRPLITTLSALTGFILLLMGFLFLAWRLDLLTYVSGRGGPQPVAAAITFVGALVTVVGTTLGILLKYSTDVRAEHRLQAEADHNRSMQAQAAERIRIDSERNDVLQHQAEERLKLEAATEVIKLLSTSDGNLAPHIQRAGALFALANLGEHELTIALVSELLQQSNIQPSAAARLINMALINADELTQRDAIWLLYEYAEHFLTSDGFEFPNALLDGSTTFPAYVREWSALALGRILVARPCADWHGRTLMANTILGALSLAWLHETEARLSHNMAAILNLALAGFADTKVLFHPRQELDLLQIKADTAGMQATSVASCELAARFVWWHQAKPDGSPAV